MPISRFPFFYNPSYYNRSYYNNKLRQRNFNTGSGCNSNYNSHYINNSKPNKSQIEEIPTLKDNLTKKNNSKSSTNTDPYFFELFGLKLYFDDILLICLIFFLYQEGVKDDELFISLILLLLS